MQLHQVHHPFVNYLTTVFVTCFKFSSKQRDWDWLPLPFRSWGLFRRWFSGMASDPLLSRLHVRWNRGWELCCSLSILLLRRRNWRVLQHISKLRCWGHDPRLPLMLQYLGSRIGNYCLFFLWFYLQKLCKHMILLRTTDMLWHVQHKYHYIDTLWF